MPIYGVEKYIDKSLRSLFSQTKTEGVEFILVNDCTKDRSIEIAREVIKDFPHCTIRLIEHEVNSGVAAARQTGLDAAIGEYTIHFDPDDWCEPEMLEELYAKAKEDDADIVGCDYIMSYPSKDVYIKQSFPNNGIDCTHKFLQGEIMAGMCNKLIRHDIIRTSNIKFLKGIDLTEDLLFCCKIFPYCHSISYIPKAYLHYMQHQESMTKSNNLSNKSINDLLQVVTEIERFYLENKLMSYFSLSLMYKKAMVKIGLLQGRNSYEYINVYPEIYKYLDKLTGMKKHWRIALFSTKNGGHFFFNLICSAVQFKSKLFSKTELY